MDGPLIATVVSSSVVIATAIGGGFWKVWTKIGDQSKSIGRLEGKMDGYEKHLEGFDTRVGRLDERLNGFVDSQMKKGKRRA